MVPAWPTSPATALRPAPIAATASTTSLPRFRPQLRSAPPAPTFPTASSVTMWTTTSAQSARTATTSTTTWLALPATLTVLPAGVIQSAQDAPPDGPSRRDRPREGAGLASPLV